MNIIESAGLGKRYRRTWALRDCTLAVPDGHLVALVGPNGAGKTTLLHMAVGLVSPTAGAVRVLGGRPAGSPGALDGTAFVAQNAPLYPNLPVAAMLRVARNLNRQWDQPRAEARLAELGIPLDRKAGKLSGGQQAQLALTVALARRPRLLVLDEPLAALDPVARSDFMAAVLAAVAGEGISVVLSSWYFQPFFAEGKTGPFPMQLFGTRGVAFAAWTLAAFAIAAFAGALIRRTVPAMAAALAAWTALDVITMMTLRQHYLAPLTGRGWNIPVSVWLLRVWPPRDGLPSYIYQPVSRFWSFQLIGGGWLLGLALILLAGTVWLVRRRE